MKLAHNIRFTTINRTPQEQNTITNAIKEWLETTNTNTQQQTLTHPGLDTLYKTTIIINKQPIIRQTLQKIRALTTTDQEQPRTTTHLRLDEHNNLSFKINKESMKEGTPQITDQGDTIHVRITLSAHPKNKENATKTVKQLFDPRTNL